MVCCSRMKRLLGSNQTGGVSLLYEVPQLLDSRPFLQETSKVLPGVYLLLGLKCGSLLRQDAAVTALTWGWRGNRGVKTRQDTDTTRYPYHRVRVAQASCHKVIGSPAVEELLHRIRLIDPCERWPSVHCSPRPASRRCYSLGLSSIHRLG